MSTNDYVRFVTQQFVSYMDAPKEDRKQKKEQRRAEKEPFMNKWFGVMPLSATLLYRN
ncbi:YqzE family protein [Bacillus anthracis]|nr:YqzE family protein [Bacillus anthracis]MRS10023.1 YqzE family protein [Bacillus anthracis]